MGIPLNYEDALDELMKVKEEAAEAKVQLSWVTDEHDCSVNLGYNPDYKRTHGYGCRNKFVCDLNDGEYHEYYREDEQRANAAFIAAAREDVPDLLAEVERLRAREEWLARELAVQGNARGYESFCHMPGDYNCAWRQVCDLCGAQIKARAECWRKAADMETRGDSGEPRKVR